MYLQCLYNITIRCQCDVFERRHIDVWMTSLIDNSKACISHVGNKIVWRESVMLKITKYQVIYFPCYVLFGIIFICFIYRLGWHMYYISLH